MSYLDLPRLHFTGKFLANPSTVNNTPNNFDPKNDFPTAARIADGLDKSNNIELFWNPNGDGTFGLVECTVVKVTYANGTEETSPEKDPIIGAAVASNAGGPGAMAKIVDLDPMQQNVSEIWGMSVLVRTPGAGSIGGAFAEAPYAGIWLQAKAVPPGDIAGCGVYQSTLNDVAIETDPSRPSRFLTELHASSPDVLSMNFVVHAHNSQPRMYLVSKATTEEMVSKDVPQVVIDKMAPIMAYRQHPSDPAGQIPTLSYFEKLLTAFIGADALAKYCDAIVSATEQPYQAPTPFEFAHGGVVGTIGPHADEEPVYFTPVRMMTPPKRAPAARLYLSTCFFAPFRVDRCHDGDVITLNLGNSLPTKSPGGDFDADKLGTLRLCWFELAASETPSTGNASLLPGDIDYRDTHNFYALGSGIVRFPIGAAYTSKPLGLVRVDDSGNVAEILLHENPQGYYLRADRSVYRMNPGCPTKGPSIGDTATIDFYVRQFGAPKAGETITVALLSPDEAQTYTNSTPGTGGSAGVVNLSVPQSALEIVHDTVVTDGQGKAQVTIQAHNPGNPRAYVDGQIYLLRYGLTSAEDDYVQGPDDLISVQIYQDQPDGSRVTWDGCVRDVLAQYGKLYPVMSRFGLGDYVSVKRNRAKIRAVLAKDMVDTLHMPVTRDMSTSRTEMILKWFDNGMPER